MDLISMVCWTSDILADPAATIETTAFADYCPLTLPNLSHLRPTIFGDREPYTTGNVTFPPEPRHDESCRFVHGRLLVRLCLRLAARAFHSSLT
jgi:hypothetical protein